MPAATTGADILPDIVRQDLSDLGEFGLIARLVARLGGGPGVLVGPGDDCAVLQVGDRAILATTDMLVEGRHFDLGFSTPEDVGFKAIAVSVSDVAAMGGLPTFALISLGAPQQTRARVLEALYSGIAEAARSFGVVVVGGDTVAAGVLTINVALLGEPRGSGPILRSGARPGDVLCVTGSLGAAAAGLQVLRRGNPDLLSSTGELVLAHRRGRARLREGQAAARIGAHAMIDVSDGLIQDAAHLADASGSCVRIDTDSVPRAPGVREITAALGVDVDLALRGGDDYELAIALAPDAVSRLAAAIAPTPLSVIGGFEEGSGCRGLDGVDLMIDGWDHFRGKP